MASTKKEYSLGFIIGAQLKSSFPAAFKKVEKQLAASQKAVKNAGKAWKDFGTNASKLVLGVVGGAAAVGTAVWKMTDDIATAGDEIGDTASALRMNAEALQELQYAFKQNGVEVDDFTGMVTKMNSTLAKAAAGEKNPLEEYGLSAEKLARMAPEQALKRISDYMRQMEDPVERSALALELFGKQGGKMEAALMMGSDAMDVFARELRQTGDFLSNEVLEQADAYDKAKTKFTRTVNGIKTQLFSRLLPIFSGVFDKIAGKIQTVNWSEWGEKIAGWVDTAIPKIETIATTIGDFIDKIWNGINTVKDFVGGWDNLAAIIGTVLALKTAISGITAVVNTVMAAVKIGGLAISLLTNPIGWVVIAIAAVIAIIIVVIKYWDEIKVAALIVWEMIKTKIAEVSDFFIGIWNGIRDFFIGILVAIAVFFVEKINEQIKLIQAIAIFFIETWENIKSFIKGIWDSIVGFVSGAFESAKKLAQTFVDKILGFFKPISDFFKGIGDKIASLFTGKKTMQVDVQTTGAAIAQHAAGGIFTRPHFAQIAEAGDAEAVVPINNKPQSRSIWETAGRMAGFTTPQRGGRSSTVVTVPVTINVQGNADTETVKQLEKAGRGLEEAIVERVIVKIQRREKRLSYA